MKSLLKKINNIIPYIFIIIVYFFFINIEAQKKLKKTKITNQNTTESTTSQENIKIPITTTNKIEIPVIPFFQ